MKKAILFDAFTENSIHVLHSSSTFVNQETHRKILSTLCDILENDFDFVFYICNKKIKFPIVESPKIAYALASSRDEVLAITSSISQYYHIMLAIHCNDKAYKGKYVESDDAVGKLITCNRFLNLCAESKRYELLLLGN